MRNLNYRHLLYFWQVARLGHLTRAARQLSVSQSAMSAQIRTLEHYLGQPLFDRAGRGLVLTEFGTTILDYADGIFGLGQELMAAARGGKGSLTRNLRVGSVATLSRNFLENLLRPLLGVTDLWLNLESGSLDELLGRLHVHNLDVVLSNRPVVAESGRQWRCARIDRQSVCFVGPPAAQRKSLSRPMEIARRRINLPGPSSDIRSQFDLWCERRRIVPDIATEVDDMALLRLVARDSGLPTLLPEVVVQDELREGRLQRYARLPGVYENFYAITAPRRTPSPLLQQLLAGEKLLRSRPVTALRGARH